MNLAWSEAEKSVLRLAGRKRGDLLKAAVWSWAREIPGHEVARRRIGILGAQGVVVQDAKTLLGQDWGWFTPSVGGRSRRIPPYPVALHPPSVLLRRTEALGSVQTERRADYLLAGIYVHGLWGYFVNIPADELYLLTNVPKSRTSQRRYSECSSRPVNGLENWKLYESRRRTHRFWLGSRPRPRRQLVNRSRFTFVSLDGHKNLIVQDCSVGHGRVQGRIDDLSIPVSRRRIAPQQGQLGQRRQEWPGRPQHGNDRRHSPVSNEIHAPEPFSGQIQVRDRGMRRPRDFLAGSGSPGLTVVSKGGNRNGSGGLFRKASSPGPRRPQVRAGIGEDRRSREHPDRRRSSGWSFRRPLRDAEGNLVVYDPRLHHLSELQIVIDSIAAS